MPLVLISPIGCAGSSKRFRNVPKVGCEAHRTDARQKAQMSLFEVGGQANPLTPNFIFLLLVET